MKGVFFSILVFFVIGFQACKKKETTGNEKPVASFSISGFESAVPCVINFINNSQKATSFEWSFGDGSTSSTFNPTHTYTLNGTYLLKLKVTGPGGVDSVCKILAVEALPNASKSAFSYFIEKCTGTPVGISFKSVNPLSTNTVWDFGDGIININRDPIIQFLVPGDFTIKYSSSINGIRDTVTRILQLF